MINAVAGFLNKQKKEGYLDTLALLVSVAAFYLLLYLSLKDFIRIQYDFPFFIEKSLRLNFAQPKTFVDPFHPFGYTLLLGAFNSIFRSFIISGKVLSALSASLVLFFAYKTVAIASSKKVAFLTEISLLANTAFITWALLASSDMTCVSLMMISIFFLLQKNPSISNLVFSGFFLGLGYLIRYSTIILVIPLVLYILFNKNRHAFAGALVFITALLLTISPLLLSNFIATGNPLYLPTITINIWTGVYGQSDSLVNYPPLTPIPNTAFQIFLKNPPIYIRHWIGQLIEFVKLDLIGSPLKYLFPLGVYLIVLREKNKKLAWLLIFSLFFILSLAHAYINPRYALFSVPFIIATCCYSAYFIIQTLINKLPRHYTINVLAILLLVYGFFIVKSVFSTAKNELYNNPLSHAIKLVSDNLNKDGLRDNKEVVCFNGEFYNLASPTLERFYLPNEILYMDKKNGVTELDNYLKTGGYRYIIYEETVGVKRFPNLKVLLEPERLPKEYHLLLLIDLPKVAVYKYGQ